MCDNWSLTRGGGGGGTEREIGRETDREHERWSCLCLQDRTSLILKEFAKKNPFLPLIWCLHSLYSVVCVFCVCVCWKQTIQQSKHQTHWGCSCQFIISLIVVVCCIIIFCHNLIYIYACTILWAGGEWLVLPSNRRCGQEEAFGSCLSFQRVPQSPRWVIIHTCVSTLT